MYRLWILFCQIVTATLAAIFVVSLVTPDWLPWRSKDVVAVRESPGPQLVPASALLANRQALTFSEAARKAIPSVVNIASSRQIAPRTDGRSEFYRRFWGLPEREAQRSLGSGVIVSKDGYLLTNNHVVDGANQIEIYLADGRTLPAKLIGTDPETDLAVLKVDAANLVPITFSSSDSLRVGDVVLAIGDPFGVGQTVTLGIVSALGKRGIGDSDLVDFIQTDAAINPGNSGGALVDVSGNLIGINSMIYSESGGSQGIGFAIPSMLARNVMEQLIETGTVRRGFFGVRYSNVDEEVAQALGLGNIRGPLIRAVIAGSPADKAGLRPGDVLISVNAVPVPDTLSANRAIYALMPGLSAPVVIQRAGEKITLTIVVGKRQPVKKV
jgi:serine protease DegQ